ncbi:hypothetical protein [Clostridium sp.]|uniref:hypothetical protein n=1 Tax=Clostridium sp. TaxID=1506 RepID=UPI002FC6BD2F
MGYEEFRYKTHKIPYSDDFYILDYKHMDINGDNIEDDIYLIGKRDNFIARNFAHDIRLVVYDSKTNRYCTVGLGFNYGYNSRIELQTMNHSIVNIIICIDSGELKSVPFHYIYNYVNNRLVKIYDYEKDTSHREFNANNIIGENQEKQENKTSSIDISDVKPIYSETERDINLEEAIRKEYVLNEKGIRYYYNKVDLNDDGVPEIFAYLVGSSVCCKITGACQAAIFKVEHGQYKLLSKIILIKKPLIISDERTNGYRDIITMVDSGEESNVFVRTRYDGITYPMVPYLQSRVKEATKIYGISVVSDEESKNPGITIK